MASCAGQVREFLTPCCRSPKHRQDPSALQKQSGTGLSRQGSYDPFAWALSPRDFFTTNPFTLMRRMTEDMDCIFGQTFNTAGPGGFTSGHWVPAIEVSEKDGQYCVHAELPGLTPEDLKVEVEETG
jgi:hypothetical protein